MRLWSVARGATRATSIPPTIAWGTGRLHHAGRTATSIGSNHSERAQREEQLLNEILKSRVGERLVETLGASTFGSPADGFRRRTLRSERERARGCVVLVGLLHEPLRKAGGHGRA
jgi:hypothetical protein